MDKILSELSSSLKQILKVKIPTPEATDNEEWFYGRDVILGFSNINVSLSTKVKKAYKSLLSAVYDLESLPASNNKGRAVDNPGRYIAPSKLTKAS